MSPILGVGDHLPLGKATSGGLTAFAEEKGVTVRPFGLRFTIPITAQSKTDLSTVRYDTERQISLTQQGAEWVPVITIDSPLTVQSTGEIGSPNYDEIFDKN